VEVGGRRRSDGEGPGVTAVLFAVMPVAIQVAVGAVMGVLLVRRTMRTNRRAPEGAQDEVVWEEVPLPIRRQDVVVSTFIAVHVLSHLALLALAVRDALLPGRPPALAYWGNGTAVIQAALLAGMTSGFLASYRNVAPVSIGLSATHARFGAHTFAWSRYGRFAVDRPGRVLRAYSAVLPEVASAVWHPPTDALLERGAAVLAAVLPEARPPRAGRGRWSPVLALAAMATAILAGGWLVSGRLWSAAYFFVASVTLLRLSPLVLRRFGLA
jgi:hypothetical protein